MSSPRPRPFRILAGLAAAASLAGCGSTDGGEGKRGPGTSPCGSGTIEEGGECVLDPYRHEPDQQLDTDNVMYFGTDELELLSLPPPPKSGFRIIMEPQYVESGLDEYRCQAWPVPDLANEWVYTAQLYTTPGLHHANLYGLEQSPEGPQPYPGCRGRADGQIFGQISTIIAGGDTTNLYAPDVLFANSTQVVDTERYALPEGYAYRVFPGREVMTDVHLQNTAPETIRVEGAWDFFTMPADQVTNEAAMFVSVWLDFLIPPRAEKTLSVECAWDGGNVAAIMPHTHQWATGFDVEFGTSELYPDGLMAGQPIPGTFQSKVHPYARTGTGLADSDIEVYDPVVDTDGMNAVRFQCHYENTTDNDMCNGFAGHEMCFLFGYVSPPTVQRVGLIPTEGAPCISLDPDEAGQKRFDVAEYLSVVDGATRDRLVKLFTQGGLGFGGCPQLE